MDKPEIIKDKMVAKHGVRSHDWQRGYETAAADREAEVKPMEMRRSVHDWIEDYDSPDDNGEYMHTCEYCETGFFGHKRCGQTCKKCWIKWAAGEVKLLRGALEYYADEKNWFCQVCGGDCRKHKPSHYLSVITLFDNKNGYDIARAALKGGKDEQK